MNRSRRQKGGIVLEAGVLLAVPVTLVGCVFFQVDQSALLSLGVLLLSLALFFAGFEKSRPPLRQIMPTVVLAATAAASRVLFAPFPDVKPVSAICILAGAVFGRRCGFMVGALAALVSNFFFGQGPWTPWQMYAWGLIGYLSGVFAQVGMLDKRPILFTWGFVSALLFGALLNSFYIVGFIHPLTFTSAVLAFVAAAPFDITHGVATVVFLAIIFVPWKKKLARIKQKFELS